jgi:hypothetical protein
MVWQRTDCKINLRWCKSLALQGLVIVMVEFRNAYIKGKPRNPFPCGLNDCASAAKYVHAHKQELGISKLITSGESGGGNLAIATALKANREGWMEAIDGVYAVAPYISGAAWGWTKEQQLAELPSLIECDDFAVNMRRRSTLQIRSRTSTCILLGPYKDPIALLVPPSGDSARRLDTSITPGNVSDIIRSPRAVESWLSRAVYLEVCLAYT